MVTETILNEEKERWSCFHRPVANKAQEVCVAVKPDGKSFSPFQLPVLFAFLVSIWSFVVV